MGIQDYKHVAPVDQGNWSSIGALAQKLAEQAAKKQGAK